MYNALMICTNCQQEYTGRKHPYCRDCHAAYMREWRKAHPLTLAQKIKDRARSYANEYLKLGKILRESCSECGDEKAEMHHPDYAQPLKIIWLCRTHHLELHRREPNRLNNLHFIET